MANVEMSGTVLGAHEKLSVEDLMPIKDETHWITAGVDWFTVDFEGTDTRFNRVGTRHYLQDRIIEKQTGVKPDTDLVLHQTKRLKFLDGFAGGGHIDWDDSSYKLAARDAQSVAHRLEDLAHTDLSVAFTSLAETVMQRRDAYKQQQLQTLAEVLEEQQDPLWVKLVAPSRDTMSYFAAKLAGFYLKPIETDVAEIGILLEDTRGSIGTEPEKTRPQGVYKKTGANS